MKMTRYMAVAALIAAMPLAQAAAQTTVAGNNTSASNANGYLGQSFTVAGAAPTYRSITFSFQTAAGANAGTAGSKLYLFSSQYTGTPANLASAASLGSATFNNSVYSFAPSLTLNTGSQYFAYSDTSFIVGYNATDSFAGGNLYYFNNTGGTYTNYISYDTRFMVTSMAAAAPEPAAWALMILGFGVAGGALRRRAVRSSTGQARLAG